METERKPLFDTFDWLIGIGAVPFQSPPIYVAAALLVIARHWSLPARGFFVLARDVFGAREVTPLWCKVFPGLEGYLVTPPVEPPKADEGAQKAGASEAIPVSVSVSGTDTAKFDLASVPSDLTYEELVTILAGQIAPSGKPASSGKKIYSYVGGNYNEFTALMRRLRPKDGEPADPPRTTTPIAGRPTCAVFRETDPELAFRPPE